MRPGFQENDDGPRVFRFRSARRLTGFERPARPRPCVPVSLCRGPDLQEASCFVPELRYQDTLPIRPGRWLFPGRLDRRWFESARVPMRTERPVLAQIRTRSEEHTSELQSLAYLVCRLL